MECQYACKVLEIMKDAKCALSEDEYKAFIESIQKMIQEGIKA